MSRVADLRAQGFDRSRHVPFTQSWRVRCSQCEAACVNEVPRHERGCPNTPRDDDEREE